MGGNIQEPKVTMLYYRKEGAPRSIPIPGKDNDEVAIGTLMSILRQAGLKESDFDKI